MAGAVEKCSIIQSKQCVGKKFPRTGAIDSKREISATPAPIKHVVEERTRHGRVIRYYRRGSGPRIRLPDDIDSPEFAAAYRDAPEAARRVESERAVKRVAPVANKLWGAFRGARSRARQRGLEFSLTEQWCVDTLAAQGGRCALTGMQFSLAGKGMRGRDPYGPSFDRIDCSKGYTPENTRIVILAINIMLADWGTDVFEAVVSQYQQHQRALPAPLPACSGARL